MSLSIEATDLLLRLLEARALLYARSTVLGHHGAKAGAELIDSGLVAPAGFTKFVADETEDDPQLVEVEMDHERGELGYHSRFRGWISIDRQELQRYRPNLEAILWALLGDELRRPRQGLVEIDADIVWEVGQLRLVKSGLTSVWLVRRLSDRVVEDRLAAANGRHAATARRLILTSTPRERVRESLQLEGSTVVPLQDVLSAYEPFSIDLERLRARFAGKASAPVTEPLHLSDDGSTLTILGIEIVFGGNQQRKAIRILVDAHKMRRGVNAAKTLEEAGYGSGVRLFSQAFKKQWPVLKQYLRSRNKLWHFEI